MESFEEEMKAHGWTPIVRPESIPDDIWQNYHEIGHSVANLVAEAFVLYSIGRFRGWDTNRARDMFWRLCKVNEREAIRRRNLVCEYILVEKMKKMDFFCCELCSMSLFNYKQALIHFTSEEHREMETAEVKDSRIGNVVRVLETITNLPARLAEDDSKKEQDRGMRSAMYNLKPPPIAKTIDGLMAVDGTQITAMATGIEDAKKDSGLRVMAELDEMIREGQTSCLFCRRKYLNREDFYAHFISYFHVKNATTLHKSFQANDPTHRSFNDFTTVTVNVLKRDLI